MTRLVNNLSNKKWLRATVIFAVLIFLFLSFSQTVLARELENDYPKIPLPNVPGVDFKGSYSLNDIADKLPPFDTIDPLSGLIYYLFIFSISTVGIVAFGMIIYAGVMFMTSGARPQLRMEAQNRLRNVILGIALLLGSVILLNTINPELSIINVPDSGRAILGAEWPPVKTDDYAGGPTGVAGLTLSGTKILSFDLKIDPPYNYQGPEAPNPVKPGETAKLHWGAPEGSGDCVAYSSPVPVDGWGSGNPAEIPGARGSRTSIGREIASNSTVDGYALTIPKNQKEGIYTLNISCAGTRAIASATLAISSLTKEQIAAIPKATVDLKLQKTGDAFPKDLVVLSPQELKAPFTDGTFFYTVKGPAVDQGTIKSCTLEGGGKNSPVNKDFSGGTITSFAPGLGIAWLTVGGYTFSCKDKASNQEIGSDTVNVITEEMLTPF